MAVLEAQGIPRYLLETGNNQLDARSIDTLLAYSFITASPENETYDIHRLVQLAIRKRLIASKTEVKWVKEALMLLSDQFPNGDYDSWKSCAVLFPHALKVLEMDIYSPAEAIALGILQSKVGWYYLNRVIVEKAEAFNRRALDNIESATDAKQEDILAIKAKRVIILQKLARYDDAEDLAQEVWRGRRIALGPKDDKTMESFITLSLIYQEQGKYLEAEKAIRKVLQSLKRGLAPDDELVLEAKRRLATTLFYRGKSAEAEQFVREAIEGYERTTGPKNVTLLKAKWRLAWILHEQDKYAEAEIINLQTWKQQIELIGPNHPDSIKSRHGLANDLQAQLKFSAAESHKREIYSKAVDIVGATHIYSLIAASSLASCLVASNLSSSRPIPELYAEAEALYRLSLDGRQKVLREDHPKTLSARTDLATIQRLRGSIPPSEIEAFERVTLSKLKQTLGREHPLTLKSRDGLARILWVQRDIKFKRREALQQAKKVLKVGEKRQGWERDKTRQVAELVVEMLAEGRERRQLREKVGLKRKVTEYGKDE
jgi:tetratricopeptide (TPR) repeat protein